MDVHCAGIVPDAPHTHLLQMNLHSAAGPCCSAKKMSPITMLYLDQVPMVYHFNSNQMFKWVLGESYFNFIIAKLQTYGYNCLPSFVSPKRVVSSRVFSS